MLRIEAPWIWLDCSSSPGPQSHGTGTRHSEILKTALGEPEWATEHAFAWAL